MKILVVCQHYWPEPYPLTDICEELVHRGHTVDLITDIPNYPMGEIYSGYKKKQHRDECHNGVHIIRTFTIPRKHNIVFRILNYYSYAISSSVYTKKLSDDYDVVFANQTSPVMMSSAAFAYAKKYDKKVVMYCMDLWPACLAAGGVSETSPIYKFFGIVSKRLYNKADRVLITSQMFKEYLIQQHQVAEEKIKYLPQYAATNFEAALYTKSEKQTIDLMFAGNIGAAQSLNTILEAADILRDEQKIRWHIIGDGSELENLKKIAANKKLDSVIFYGRKPVEEMPYYYVKADAMLVTLTADPFISLTLPGKVQTYLAVGKPIIGAAFGEIPNVIKEAQCGYCAKAGDPYGLAQAIRCFIENKNKEQLGKNARLYYEQHFTRKMFMDKLEQELLAYAGQQGDIKG